MSSTLDKDEQTLATERYEPALSGHYNDLFHALVIRMGNTLPSNRAEIIKAEMARVSEEGKATLFLFPKNRIISESGNKLCRWLIARFMRRRHLLFLTIAAKILNGVIDILLCKRSILISAILLTSIDLWLK